MNPHQVRDRGVLGVADISLVMQFVPEATPSGGGVLPRLKPGKQGAGVKPSFVASAEPAPAAVIKSEHTSGIYHSQDSGDRSQRGEQLSKCLAGALPGASGQGVLRCPG